MADMAVPGGSAAAAGMAAGNITRGAAEWLGLAAAPTFAGMALMVAIFGGQHAEMFCMTASDPSPLTSAMGGMAAMYALMSLFHAAPWLRLMTGRRCGARSHFGASG